MLAMDAGRKPVSRDLTRLFSSYRTAKRDAQRRQEQQPKPYPGSEALLGPNRDSESSSPGRKAEGPALPPAWVDYAEKARDELKEIEAQLVQLSKAQQRRLLKVFTTTDEPDREIEAISGTVSAQIRCCEQSIHQVRTAGLDKGSSAVDEEFRQNVQRSLAAELLQLSKQCRESTQVFFQEVKRRQNPSADLEAGGGQGTAASSGAGAGGSGGAEGAAGAGASGGGGAPQMQDQQAYDLEQMENVAAQRSSEINQIASTIHELHRIFKDLAVLVIDQGTVLDRIDYNVEKIHNKSTEAKGQLRKAVEKKRQTNARFNKCFIAWLVADLLMLLILLCKYQLKYGLKNVLIFVIIIAALVAGCVFAGRSKRPELFDKIPKMSAVFPDGNPVEKAWKQVKPGPQTMAKLGSYVGFGNLRQAMQATRGP